MTAASYNPALKSAAVAGDWQVAISAIDVMAKAALTNKDAGPDVVCFNYAMAACAKAGECEVREKAEGEPLSVRIRVFLAQKKLGR